MLAQPHRRHQTSATARRHSPNPYSLDYDIWAEMLMKSNRNSFGRRDTEQNFGPWTRRTLLPPASVSSASDEVKYPPPSNTRAQVIERYRQEMMELVRNMPEGKEEEPPAYELSLRDIVESPVAKKPEVESAEDSFEMERKQRGSREGKNGVSWLLMKAFLPRVRAALGGRKRIAGVGGGKGAKVSPKPSTSDCEERSCSSGSCDSRSSRGRNEGGTGSCYSFLHKHRSKSMDI